MATTATTTTVVCSINPILPTSQFSFTRTTTGHLQRRFLTVSVRAQDSDGQSSQQQQQLNLSVLRFTLGIPGLDESYLPRWIGVGFGLLVLLNHFLSTNPTSPQIRSEILGFCLAAFSAMLPYLGRFLEGVSSVNRLPLPEESKQIFILSENLSTAQKEDLAWASYALLRNTNTMSVFIAVKDFICIRGCWDTPEKASKTAIIDQFKDQIQQAGFRGLTETLYFPRYTETQVGKILPKGVLSFVVHPISSIDGLVLVASNSNYAYSDKDIAWIRSVANKFQLMAP
ncbi:protein COFACTOR ASSEMBLY OF COMPLEX C SUBUNIT B CCB2, chloroplastic-like isoform X2 [Carex rostrata]